MNRLWWLSKTPSPKANNQRVLKEYSPDMKRLVKRGYRATVRPSGHVITPKFKDRGGFIPPNLLVYGNNDSNGYYLEQCKKWRETAPGPVSRSATDVLLAVPDGLG